MVPSEFDLSIPEFGARILSDDVITNPDTPPNILSDSLSITSANFGLILNFLDIFSAAFDANIEFVSNILPCELATYLLEIIITSPFSNNILLLEKILDISSNKSKLPSCRFDFRGITVNATT